MTKHQNPYKTIFPDTPADLIERFRWLTYRIAEIFQEWGRLVNGAANLLAELPPAARVMIRDEFPDFIEIAQLKGRIDDEGNIRYHG